MVSLLLRDHVLIGRLGAIVLTCTAMTMGFSIESVRASDYGKLLVQTDLYRVTADDTPGTGANWCFPRGKTNYQANIFIRWRVTAQEDLTGKSAGYQHHLADIWSAVIQHCPATSVAHISNFVNGVRLLGYYNGEVPDLGPSLKPSQQEVPVNTILVSKMENGKFEAGMVGRYQYQSLDAARAKRKPETIVTLPPPPRPLISPELGATPSVDSNQNLETTAGPDTRHLDPPSNQENPIWFDVAGFPSSNDYLRIYFGEFKALQAQDNFEENRFPALYVHAVRAYGRVCGDYLPQNSPVETIDYSYSQRGGFIYNSEEIHERYPMDPRFSSIVQSFNRGAGIDAEAIKLFQRNLCATHQTLQFLENLLRFGMGESPIQELAPEPIKRYTTSREFKLRKSQKKAGTPEPVKQETKDIRYAIDWLARVPLQDRADPTFVNDFYRSRSQYTLEVNAVEEEERGHGPSVLLCRYIERYTGKNGTYGTEEHQFFWRNPRPTIVTEEYLQKLSPSNPIRFIGKAIDRCPTNKPIIPLVHPADILASLKIQKRSQPSVIEPPVTTSPPATQQMAPLRATVPSVPTAAPSPSETIIPVPASPPISTAALPPSEPASIPPPAPPVEFRPAVTVVNPFERALTMSKEKSVLPQEMMGLYLAWEYASNVQEPEDRKLSLQMFVRNTHQFSSHLQKKINNSQQSLSRERHPPNRRATEKFIDKIQILKDEN